jgi:hypothetical protein
VTNGQPTPTFTAADLCDMIASRINLDQVHVYGAEPNDAVLVGLEHTTTVLVAQYGQQHWFRVEVHEVTPDTDDPLTVDHDVLSTLARRAGVGHRSGSARPCRGQTPQIADSHEPATRGGRSR